MIDIGAAHGELSILFKRAGATVVAVEPAARAYPIFENLRANDISSRRDNRYRESVSATNKKEEILPWMPFQ